MKMPQRAQLKAEALRYAGLMLGTAVLSFGLYNVHSQSDITEGGVLGLQLLIQNWFGVSPSVIGPVLDLICYLIGWRILGGAFLKNAMVSTLSYGFFYSIHERMGYLLPDLGGSPVLAALVGGLFVGIGVGLVVRAGGATGGDDVLALVLNKLAGVKIEKCYFFTDFVVLVLSRSYIPALKIACSLLTVTISSYIIGKMYQGEENADLKEETNLKQTGRKELV